MSHNSRQDIWIGLVIAVAAIVAIQTYQPKDTSGLALIEPAAGTEETIEQEDAALPTPARPLFKANDPDKVTTLVAETPQANDTNGKPRTLKTDLGLEVSPLCFEQLFGVDGPKGPIDVTTCESGSGYKNIQTGIEDGRFRSVYEFPSEPDMPAEKGFSSYELLGDIKAGTVIQSYNETGGTGRFSSLVLVKLVGNTLSLVDQIAGGDRCNNGLTEAKVENQKLSYSVNVTPGDLPVLAWGEDKSIKPYEDLEASAMSCFATATFEDGNLAKISLNAEAGKQGTEWTRQFSKQECFNKQFKAALESGKKDMTAEEFKSFMNEFQAACAK